MTEHQFRESRTPRCPSGYILRDSYTTKNGTYVPARCIKARSLSGEKAKLRVRNLVHEEREAHKNALKMAKNMCSEEGCKIPTSCPKGEILRAAYVKRPYRRSNGTKVEGAIVPPSCITNRGAPGKGERRIVLDPMNHIGHGYEDVLHKTEEERHRSLMRAFKEFEKIEGPRDAYGTLIKMLVARSNLTIRTQPDSSKVMKADADWLSKKLKEWKNTHLTNNKKNKKPHVKKATDDKKDKKPHLKKATDDKKDKKPHVKKVAEKKEKKKVGDKKKTLKKSDKKSKK